MDFLKIRKKAKERARAGASAPVTAPVSQPEPERRGTSAGEPPVPTPSPQPSPAAETVDPRFTTWRPGTAMRPIAEVPAPPPAPAAELGADDPARLRRDARPVPPRGELPAGELRPAAPAYETPARASAPRDPLDEFFFRDEEELPGLAAFPAEDQAAPAQGPEDPGVEEYLTFRLGVEEYAVAIERVREVLKRQLITEVPRAPAGVLGVVTVRGEVVAVFDPRWRLGLPGAPPAEGSGRIVIVDDGQGPCGLLVDSLASVVRLARGSIEPCPQGIGGASAECLAGIGRERTRLFTVLELGALLRLAPARGGRPAHAGA
jgi:purine-binding chemotaxis protein CheW